MAQKMRMSSYLLICLLFLCLSGNAGYFDAVEEVAAGNNIGIGARQMAMGGAGVMSMDGAALFYNPANLARIPRIEFNFGLTYQKYKSKTGTQSLGINQVFNIENNRNNTRVSNVILAIPYPTYRGSFVLGMGMARTSDFDRATSFFYKEYDGLDSIWTNEEALETGGLNQWAFGFGLDLSPRISFGGAVMLYTGKHTLNLYSPLYQNQYEVDLIEQQVETRYLGLGAKASFAIQLSQYLGWGLGFEIPVSFSVERESFDNDEDLIYFDEYNLKRPFQFFTGIVVRTNNLTILADLNYADWSQIAYKDNIILEIDYNSDFKKWYREVVGYRFGAEYVLPSIGLSLRGGYFYDPVPVGDSLMNGIAVYENKKSNGITFGIGLLIDQVMTLDLAFVHHTTKNNYYRNSLTDFDNSLLLYEEVDRNRLYLTGAYRF